MKKTFWMIIAAITLTLACNKPEQTNAPTQEMNTQETEQAAISPEPESAPLKDAQDLKAEDTPQNPPCLKASGPFCEVSISEGACDPKLNEHNYKAGDTLYWINHTQYDTIDCYYTEEEYNKDHDPKDCAELQDNGRGCVIDDSPDCNLMLDGDDCTVRYTRSSCDERLIDLNKGVGDKMPGVLIKNTNSQNETIECFYTEKERNQFLKKMNLKCSSKLEDKDNICKAVPSHGQEQPSVHSSK